MCEKHVKYPAIAVYLIAITCAFHAYYSPALLDLPKVCDEFGYLNIAKAAVDGKLFKNHSERPFDKGMLEYLKRSPLDYHSFEYLICPHAYYLHKKFKIINQYPPGTGLLMAPLPLYARRAAFPAVCIFVFMLFALLAVRAGTGRISFLSLNMIAIAAAAAFLSDFFPRGYGNYNWVNSHAPTFGLLFAAGYLLDRKPLLSFALLGASSLFRVVNVILFIPFLLTYLWKGFSFVGYLSKETMFKTVRAGVFLLVGGLGLYFLYMWALLGNPFLHSYPSDFMDLLKVSSFKEIAGNILFYLHYLNPWFLFHAFIAGLIVIMGLYRKIPVKWVIFSFIIILFNFSYWSFHRVLSSMAQRYAFASGIITAGILFRYAEDFFSASARMKKAVNITGIFLVVASMVFSAVKFPRQNIHQLFNHQIQSYTDCFSCYDVIWAESRSGTVEYATGKAAFRFQWGSAAARKAVIAWLDKHGYRQAVWMDDMEKSFLDTVDIEAELKGIPVDYTIKSTHEFGTVFELKGNSLSERSRTSPVNNALSAENFCCRASGASP